MLNISYLFDITYHNMHKLNKAALKQMLFFDIEYISDCSVHIKCYFNMELIIGIGVFEV